MPHWERELKSLLESLGVTFEDAPKSYSTLPEEIDDPTDSNIQEQERLLAEAEAEEDHISLVRREMETTLRDVSQLSSDGMMDLALRDDIIYVFHALTQAIPSPSLDVEEWRIGKSATILHFCRIVSRLNHELTDQD